MLRATFEEQLAFARRYEKGVARWLMQRAWRILPTYDFSGSDGDKTPTLLAADGDQSLVLPDLLACKDGDTRWVEVKYKDSADWTRLTNRLETGISLRLWTHYVRVRAVTGISVWIMFVHRLEGEVRGAEIETLSRMPPRIYDGRKMGRGGMAFFPWDGLQLMTSLSDILPEDPEAAAQDPVSGPAGGGVGGMHAVG